MRAGEIQPKKLVIFDIDDTLVYTQTKVHVIKDGEVVKSLNSHDFTHYKLQPGESFDFGDFRNAKDFFDNSKPNIPMMNQLKRDINTGNKVVMVTAREDFDDKELFLDTFRKYGVDMSKVHVYRAGNIKGGTTEQRKKLIIKTLLDKDHYTKAIMYDDAKPNLHTFIELKKDHPDTRFYAWHVSLDGEASEYMREDTLAEKKKRKKRLRWAAYGPGPYGLYGWDSGYSGDGGGDGGVGEALDKPTPSLQTIAKKHNVSIDYLKIQLRNGISVEMEHTSDHETAKEIALDHLNEKPDYYQLLKKVEEAAYPGNIGAMELAKFWRSAGDKEKVMLKQLLAKNDYRRAWALIQGVTGVKLVGKEFQTENFADGKKPGRKGLAKRTGVNCKQSVSNLRKIAKNSSGERSRMAHWCANMKSGRGK